MNYSQICNHDRLRRINNNFVRCLSCGQSLVNQNNILLNKSRNDFTKENPNFTRNFDRNFDNSVVQIDETSNTDNAIPPDYYTDRSQVNLIVVDRHALYNSIPEKYNVYINGKTSVLDRNQISKLLADIHAIRIDIAEGTRLLELRNKQN